MTTALDLHHVPSTAIAPAPEVMWARRHLPSEGLEAYRIIRTRLALHPLRPQIVLVTSASPSDGKSVTAVNLAGALALGGSDVLLLDGDLRQPAVHRLLGVDAEPGLAQVLRGTHTLQQACRGVEGNRGLYVLPAGSAGHQAGDLLQTPGWPAFLDATRTGFHYVVIDAPPVGASAAYEWLAGSADGLVLVVRQGRTGRAACREAVRRIPSQQLLGIVWNA